MKDTIDTLRITAEGRDQLIKLKRITGVENWNILCRWALCASLTEDKPPHPTKSSGEGNAVEIPWKTFAGAQSRILHGLMVRRSVQDSKDVEPPNVTQSTRDHVHRGLWYLASGSGKKSVSDFFKQWFSE